MCAFIAPESHSQIIFGFPSSERGLAMKPQKPRDWTEEEIKVLIKLVHQKKSALMIAKELGRHLASVKRRALKMGFVLPRGRT
jgi:hypothetical protein